MCERCNQENGELQDICTACGNTLCDDDPSSAREGGGLRKLKAHGSHEEAPAKKVSTAEQLQDKRVEDGADYMPAWASTMQTQLLQGLTSVLQNEIGPVKADVSQLKEGSV